MNVSENIYISKKEQDMIIYIYRYTVYRENIFTFVISEWKFHFPEGLSTTNEMYIFI